MSRKHQPIGKAMMPASTKLGGFLREKRLEAGWSQVHLGLSAGCPRDAVCKIETGKVVSLLPSQWEALARLISCDPQELFDHGAVVKKVPEPTTALGRLIQNRRQELGFSLQEFAEKMGITLQQAKDLELRENPTAQYETLRLLARVLELDPALLAPFLCSSKYEIDKPLGRLIREYRRQRLLSDAEFADLLGVSQQAISQIERGRCPLSEKESMIVRIAKVLDVDVSLLLSVRGTRKMKDQPQPIPALNSFLAQRRLALRLTQTELGRRMRTHYGYISSIETGKMHPGKDILERFEKALGCKIPEHLLDRR